MLVVARAFMLCVSVSRIQHVHALCEPSKNQSYYFNDDSENVPMAFDNGQVHASNVYCTIGFNCKSLESVAD